MERHQTGDERGRGVVTLGGGVAAGFWVGARVGSWCLLEMGCGSCWGAGSRGFEDLGDGELGRGKRMQ